MALEITYVGGFNPFEWDELFCPLCGNNHYVSISHAAVHCKDCCAQFSVRRTAGEPGCVVDCFVKDPPFDELVKSRVLFIPRLRTCADNQSKIV